MTAEEAYNILYKEFDFHKNKSDVWIALDVVLKVLKKEKDREQKEWLIETYKNMSEENKKKVKIFLQFLQWKKKREGA